MPRLARPKRKKQSSELRSYRTYLRQNKELWHILSQDLQDFLETYVPVQPLDNDGYEIIKLPPSTRQKFFSAAYKISIEKKRLAYHIKGYDNIEALGFQVTHPRIYKFLKSLRINSIHALKSFVPALRLKSAQELRLKYPASVQLIDWYDNGGHKYL